MADRGPQINSATGSTGGSAAYAASQSATQSANAQTLNAYRPFHEHYYAAFYKYARGHILNRYNVSLQGPYVEEALRVMDLNTNIGRNTKAKKLAHGQFPFKHEAFKAWLDLHYDSRNHLLNMLWVSQDVDIGQAKAKIDNFTIDSIKNSMPYPLITKYEGPGVLKLKVIDDPYFMWYQFFNALFNVQFSTRVLKARSTFQKILVCVDVYGEMTTAIGPAENELQRTNKVYYTSDDLAQAFEFNSCVLEAAPKMGTLKNQESGDFYQFDISFKYPNTFQGTSKCELRGLRDNTIEGSLAVGVQGVEEDVGCFNRSFFEESRPNRKTNINTKDENSSLNAISHTYYDKSFKEKLLPAFGKLPTQLQQYPEKLPSGQPVKNSKPQDDSKNPQTDWQKKARDAFPEYQVEDWDPKRRDPKVYAPGKAPVTQNSAGQWAGVPYP